MFRSILHPTDFSETAYQALGCAVDLSRRHRAELKMLHVLREHDFSIVEVAASQAMLDEAYERMGLSLVSRARELLQGDFELGSEADIIFRHGGSIADEVIEEAEARDMDLIVMGTHGSSPVRQFFLGSVAEKVVRYAPCPVLVCGRPGTARGRFSKILLTVDFSEASLSAAATALDLARSDIGAIEFFHVMEEIPLPPYLEDSVAAAEQANVLKAAQHEMERFVEDLDTSGLEVSFKVGTGRASSVITREAEENGFDLIAMGTSGLRGVSRFLLGSTPTRVLRRCGVPILTVHGPSEASES